MDAKRKDGIKAIKAKLSIVLEDDTVTLGEKLARL